MKCLFRTIPKLLAFGLLLISTAKAQRLQPGFDEAEYAETLKINVKVHLALDQWTKPADLPDPQYFRFEYRSPRLAFDNIWDLWIHKRRPVALIAVQGSIPTQASFLANLYAAMVPANGSLELGPGNTFHYSLSDDPHAAVHVGWLVAMAYLSGSIEHKIDSCYKAGIKDFILTGHSQGGGITFLLTAYLKQLQSKKQLPGDIRFKIYCSAGPKPGNLFFAYDYEHRMQDWACNVVNILDWVPDVPFSVQTVNDFTAMNPFLHARNMIRKQRFPNNMVLRHVYNKLDRPSRRAQRNYQRFLGRMMAKAVKKQIPGFVTPDYYNSNYYVRTGRTIVLYPDSAYYRLYPNEPGSSDIWRHHFPQPYLYLLEHCNY